jgi:hypothetical protein
LEFKILILFMKKKWWITCRTTQNMTSKHKNFSIFLLILRERDAGKTRFQAAKTQKMTNLFMTLEFNILRLFMKNKWWLTSRTTQNTTSKHKNFNIFPLILREREAEKTRFQQTKTQKMTNFFITLEFKILRLFIKNNDGSHLEPHKTRLRNIKISTFFLLSSEKVMLK